MCKGSLMLPTQTYGCSHTSLSMAMTAVMHLAAWFGHRITDLAMHFCALVQCVCGTGSKPLIGSYWLILIDCGLMPGSHTMTAGWCSWLQAGMLADC